MRHKRFYSLVGIFVLGSLALIFIGAVFFYNQYMTAKIETYVMFFKGSLKGLDTSAPVTYRGVKIGEVRLIEITVSEKKNTVIIPVYVEFYVEKKLGFSKNPVHLLIMNGFTADISKPSFLTGLSGIELVKTSLPKAYEQKWFHDYPIFPTKNSIEKTTSIDDALDSANKTFMDISDFIRSKEIHKMLSSTEAMTQSVKQLAHNLDQYAPSAINNFNQSLQKFAGAADSTRLLADYLARYPESLLRGKK